MRRLSLVVVWAGFARCAADMISVLDSLPGSDAHDTHHFDTACALGNTELCFPRRVLHYRRVVQHGCQDVAGDERAPRVVDAAPEHIGEEGDR